jgi:hydroxyethylthiazole kinase-like uncharacterized protein yjeF
MRAAEQALIDAGSSVDALMQIAGKGAAEWVWRMAARHPVTVLCGPGNNGGDGYVIAETIRARGGKVAVIQATEPQTAAARNAAALYHGEILPPSADRHGEVLVDCLFGSGLTRPLSDDHFALLDRLCQTHRHTVAIDLPSGVETDTGAGLNQSLPRFDLTIALGAWKPAHFLMPSRAICGMTRLVPIGIAETPGAARAIAKPLLRRPRLRDSKFSRGLVLIVAGRMPGAPVLAGSAAIRGGAGYVKLAGAGAMHLPPELVAASGELATLLADPRTSAVLIGPGLGRDDQARSRLATTLAGNPHAIVLDADALHLLSPDLPPPANAVLTPHAGEVATLEKAFSLDGTQPKPTRTLALAHRLNATVVFKGADTVIATPHGQLAYAPRAPAWLAMAGTGDVLAGLAAARLATGMPPYEAAQEAVWLHTEAARIAGPGLTAPDLAAAVPAAVARAI